MRSRTLTVLFVLLFSATLFAATPTIQTLIPDTAPHGARVVVTGSGLDAPDLSLAFTDAAGAPAIAVVVARTDRLLEAVVPSQAVSGPVRVTNSGGLLKAFTFTLAPDPVYTRVTTLAASDKAHDVLKQPGGIAVGPNGMVYVADTMHNQIVAIAPAGTVTVVAGTGKPGSTDGAAAIATFKQPGGVAFDSARNVLYVADTGNHAIRSIAADGTVRTFAGDGHPGAHDGAGSAAEFKQPFGIAVDASGIVYVADTANSRICRITPDGVVTTNAGGNHDGLADGPASQALFKKPQGLAVSPSGALFIADTGNNVIRKLENGLVTTIAGTSHGGFVDGAPALAEFKQPAGIALDDAGNLFIADSSNNAVRELVAGANPVVKTIAGTAKSGFVDGPVATAQFQQPSAIAFAGALLVADSKNDAVRMIVASPTLTAIYPATGDPAGGTSVRLFGSSFVAGATQVVFGSASATNVVYVSSTEVLATTPQGTIGTVDISVTTPGGTAQLKGAFNYVPPFTSIVVNPASPSVDPGKNVQLSASGIASDNSTTDITQQVTWTSSNPAVATISSSGLAHGLIPGTVTITATLGSLTRSVQLTVVNPEPLPPDPKTVATHLDPTVVSSLADEVSFLYSGANPIQTGVVPGAITDQRVTVVRGMVRLLDGSPLPGVKITALDHPEYGKTLSRADGAYDFAFNGGGSIVLVFTKSGYVPAQRRVTSLWNEQKTIDDVALVAYDSQVTTISMNAVTAQVARGSVVTDADGARRATVIFPAGTSATLQIAPNNTQSVSSLSIRATEFTVGANGPKAMPALLPAMSGYTYCVEMSADEAVAAGATSIVFSNPVPFYVENFLNFPVGTIVPSGYYDRVKGAWMPSDNGIVLKIVSITNGLADIDTTGDGTADNASLGSIGINDAERQKLATLYTAGQSLWRVPLKHFTPVDHNWPFGLPLDATPPQQPQPTWIPGTCKSCKAEGSIIDVHNQTLGEAIPISGTPFSLLYDSGRVANQMHYKFDVHAAGTSVPGSLQRIEISVNIAGQLRKTTLPPQPNQLQSFVWDGTDAYGRTVQGLRPADVKVSYVYRQSYDQPQPGVAQAFGAPGTTPLNITRTGGEISLSQSWSIPLGQMDVQSTGFGGWTLDVQKFYDGRGHVLYDGTQTQYSDPQNTGEASLITVAGSGSCCNSGDGGPATSAQMNFPISVASASDGTIYFTDNTRVRKVDTAGIITTVVGTTSSGFSPDGPITPSTQLAPWDVAVGPDDGLYINDQGNNRIRLVSNGVMTTIAGNGQFAPCSMTDGVPAASLPVMASAFTIAPDGTLYIAAGNVFTVTPDGMLHAVAGTCAPNPPGTGIPGPALGASINAGSIAVAPDGTIFIANDFMSPQIAKIRTDGTIVPVTPPRGASSHILSDGENVSTGTFSQIESISIAANGTLLVAERSKRVRAVDSNGIVTTLAGTGSYTLNYPNIDGNGTLARGANVGDPMDARVGADGSVLVIDSWSYTIRKTQPILPVMKPTGVVVPSDDGSEAYVFDHGRHVRTVDTMTNANLYTFGYDTGGNLKTITDVDGNVTTIERDGSGNPTAIVAPGTQRTTLTVTGGNLTAVADPGGNTYQFGYSAAGLLGTFTDPRQGLHQFTYDENGLLTKDEDPAGGFVSLTRTNTTQGFSILRASAEGRTQTYNLALGPDLVDRRANTGTDGLTSTTNSFGVSVTSTSPDGTAVTTTDAADPRFGMSAPVSAGATMTLPISHKTLALVHTRATTLSDPTNPLSLATMTETFTINGRQSTMQYQASTRQATMTSAVGRTAVLTLTPKGHVDSIAPGGLTPTSFIYDGLGRVQTIQSGVRGYSFGYDSKNQLTSITDPLQRTVGFAYDATGRVITQTLPDLRTIGFTYDANGNVTSVTPPGRPAHGFAFTSVDLEQTYTPPAVPNGGATQYAYNKDRQLTLVTRPDSSTISLGYDVHGRLSTLTTPTSTYTYGYDASKGTLTSITTSDGNAMSYGYDGSLLTSATWSGGVAGSIGYTYDNDFRVATESVGSSTISFGYDPDSLLVSAGALNIARDLQTGFVTGTTLGNVSDSWSYNGFGEPMTYSASYNNTPYFSESYTRDDAGRITSKTETVVGTSTTVQYGYDPAGRLNSIKQVDGTEVTHYDYDSNSNRTKKSFPSTSAAAEVGTYDDQDRMLTYNGATYAYTANGELQTKTDATGTTTYVYDALGNLRRVTLPDTRVIDYVIDAQNRRVGKKINGTLVQGWLYGDQLRIVAELDGSNNVVSRFVYGTRSNVPDYMIKAGVTYRILSDHLGSPRLILNVASGTIAESLTYDEFGNVLGDTAQGFQPFGFAGGLYDPDTKLVRFGARDYEPEGGRWTTKEPEIFASGANSYDYATGDPVNVFDLNGLDAVTADQHNLERMYDLWEKSGFGHRETERAGFITQNSGQYGCQAWPWSAEYRQEQWPRNKPWPPGVLAIAHTHPNSADPKPSSGDQATADRSSLPIYTITRSGIYKYDPSTSATTREEDASWVNKAKQARQAHQKARQSSCGCPQ